jgi:hypothetical protein
MAAVSLTLVFETEPAASRLELMALAEMLNFPDAMSSPPLPPDPPSTASAVITVSSMMLFIFALVIVSVAVKV